MLKKLFAGRRELSQELLEPPGDSEQRVQVADREAGGEKRGSSRRRLENKVPPICTTCFNPEWGPRHGLFLVILIVFGSGQHCKYIFHSIFRKGSFIISIKKYFILIPGPQPVKKWTLTLGANFMNLSFRLKSFSDNVSPKK
jgi:hypothetical protein